MKATQATIEQRVAEVLRLRLAGAEFADIVQYAAENKWGVQERQLWNYVGKSDDLLAQATEKDRNKLLARHLAQRRLLYAKALESGDWRGALACLKDEAELQRLYDAASPAVGEAVPAPKEAGDVVKLLAERLRQVDVAELAAGEKARLTATLADAMLRAIGVDVLDKRFEALQAVLIGRKEVVGD